MRRGFNAAVCSYLSNVDLGDRGSSLERLKVLNDRSFTEEERGKPYPETADVARPGRAETFGGAATSFTGEANMIYIQKC